MAVRTPDSQLAASLRQDLPALVGRLEESGYHTETWSERGSDASGMEDQHRQQDRRQSRREPEWVEALERRFDRKRQSLRSLLYGLAS